MHESRVYKIVGEADWARAEADGIYHGSADDARDGFIHLSTAAQVPGTAAKHFTGRTDLVLLALSAADLGDALRWEPSRGGALFPHLYAPLDPAMVIARWALPLGQDGVHRLPVDVAAADPDARG